MKINTNSWHAKFVRVMFNRPKTICTYFWAFVFSTLILIVAPLAFITLLIMFTKPVLMVMVQLALIGVGAFAVVAIFAAIDVLVRYRHRRSDSVISQYIRAKREKYCTFIDYE